MLHTIGQSVAILIPAIILGPCKVRNETETERNETDRNETKQIETKRNKSKRNKTKQIETNCMERQIDICSIN